MKVHLERENGRLRPGWQWYPVSFLARHPPRQEIPGEYCSDPVSDRFRAHFSQPKCLHVCV